MQVDIAAEVSDEIQKNLASQQQAEVQAEIDNQRKVSFQSSMKVAASFEPNKFAQALQLERKSGVPARVAYDNWGQVEQIKQQDKLDGLFSTAPRTADALSNPSNAIVAKGDEDNLRRMEEAVSDSKFDEQGFFEKTLGRWWRRDTVTSNRPRQQDLASIEDSFDKIDAGEYGGEGFAFLYSEADEAGRAQMRADLLLQRNLGFDKARVAGRELAAMPQDPVERQLQQAEARGEGVAGAAAVIADNPSYLGRAAVTALPDSVPSIALAMVPVVGPALAAGNEARTASRYKFEEILQEKRIDSTDPIQLMQAIRNDDLMREVGQRSARYAAGIGAVSLASFGLLGKVLAPSSVGGKPISQGAREWINAGVQVPVQGGLEALGEFTGQVAERGQYSDVKGGEVLVEGLVGALMAGPEAGVFAGKRFTNHMIQARRAERAAGLQSDLVARSLESSTRKNDPASFDAIVGQQLAGQPNEFIEIPAAKLQELNQSGMVNIPELLENVGIDPNHFTAQVELGGTIRMKNSSYLAYLSEHDELLASSIRVASNDYSLDDVQELDRQMVADMEKVVAQFGETDQMASAYSDVMGQLLSSGYERGAADTTARQYAAVMTRLAQQTGQTVEEVMAANPLNIAREIPQQVRRIRGDDLTLMLGRLRAGDIPQSADMFGKSLRDYLASAGGLDDTGGELAAFDADVGRVGRNRLARPGGQSMDDAAMAAWERGYFPGVAREDVTPNLLIDALREEAAGNPRYSVEQENATLRDQATNLDALQEFLDREGVDLATATDDEIMALLSGEQTQGDRMDQAPLPEREDGTSERIGDKGLVIVHGSGSDSMTADSIEIVRTSGQKQGKKGRVYGGFYGTSEADAAQAEGYAGMMGGTPTLYDVRIKPGTGVLNKTGDVTRLSENYINELVGQGYGLVIGTDPRGRTEYVVIDKNAIEAIAERGSLPPMQGQTLLSGERQDDGQVLNQSQRFSEDNRLSNLSMTGPSWERLRSNNKALAKVKGADDQVTIYRATVGDTIRPDDFVAVDRAVAEMELENVIDRDGEGAKIIEQRVPVRDLLMGNDATEFVYFPEQSTLNQSARGVTARQLSDQLESQYPGLKLDLLGSGDRVTLSRIVLPKEGRGQGTGTAVMNAVVQWADDNGKTIGLTPSGDFGGSKSRLPGFYKRFGFVENKGKNRDFEISEAMYREPARTLNQSAVSEVSQIKGIDAELQAMADELLSNGAAITPDGRVSLYHRTSQAAAGSIQSTGQMTAAEDGLFFSTKRDGGTASEFGDTVLEFSIPLEELQVDDTFGSEAHVRVPLEFAGEVLDVSKWLNEERGTTLFQSQPNQQTETEAFKRWFGDSKVVDAGGNPKVMYHGTGKSFTEFKPRRAGAVFFADNPGYASKYFSALPGANNKVMQVYLSIKKPLVVDMKGGATLPVGDKALVGTLRYARTLEDVVGVASQQGYDGVIFTNRKSTDEGYSSDEYVVFKPEQIKSADKNVGSFDPASPNILEQSGGDDARGSITFGGRRDGVRRFDIRLGKKSDLSTVLHEMGHYYLEVIGDLVADGKANEALASDYAVIRDWLGNPMSGQPKTPAPKPGMTRFYHGGLAPTGGARWLSPDKEYARGYANKTDGAEVYYVDIPTDSPLLSKEFDDSGTSITAPFVAFEAPAEIASKLQKFIEEDGRGMAPLTVDQHEQFARGFEKYLAEGKAPSIELQGAFSRFKRWLTGIYRDLRALNVELSPEVRGVFDRLLASEDAITEAQEALALSEQYESSITALMTPDELANYRRASQQARDDATTEIEQEILRAEIRKDQEWYREQKRAVEREVRDELEASQPYQARKWLFGNSPYPGLGKPLRLDSAAVTELFGSKSKEARFLGRARVREGGVHPEIAASMLGYINPSEMLNDMRAVPGLAEAIKIETERRMAERYPDPRVDGSLAEKAMAAVGEREAEVQAIQLRALAREAGRKASQHRIIKEAARQHIARLKLRDVIPYTFQRASTKAAKAVEAALLDGNMPKAYEEKEKQLMNLHLYREAVKAQDLAQKKRDQAKTYMKAGAKRKRLQSASVENYELAYPDGRVEYAATKAAANQAEADGAVVTPLFNFLEQVDGLLTKYEFGTPRRAIRQQREALMAFLQSMQGEHIVVNPPEWLLLDRAERTNWKELTIDELVDVVDMIRQIDQMAKNKLQVLKGDAWAEFEPLRDAIVATVELNASKARNSAFNKSFADEIRRWGREWLGTLPADQIARELDGQDELGPVQENITTPVQLAGRNALIREKAEHQGLADLIRQFYTDDQIKGMNDASKLIAIPEIGDSMTRMQMVMLMANMGNEGNRQALLSEARGIWTAETIQAVMGKLSSNDADFVEALWAWIDKFWPEVSENEARRTGVAPAKVQGTPYPVKLADGKIRVLKGGYFPLKYDGDLSIKTSQDEVANAFKNMTAGRTAKAYTPEGHKIERVGSGGRPVKLSFGVVTSHLNEVVRDIVMTDPVNQAWRFLHDRDVQSAFEKSNLKELFTALEIWMQDTAEGEVVDSSYTTAAARWLRTGFTANVMLFNLSNSLLNLAGTHPLVVLGKRWALRGYRDAFAPANWNQMYELSTFMREARIDSFNKDLTLVQDQMAGKGGWRAAMTTAGFYLHNKLQMFMDAVTWMGAYQKGMSMDLVGTDLVTYADQRVVEASGSGVFADRSSLERGTLSRQTRQNELVRGLTTLAGYMIRKMAIARRRTAETSFKDIGQAMNWAVDMALLFTVEGLMFALVKGNIPDDDEEDQAVEWTKTAAWETAASIGGGLPPFGRPIVAGVQGFGGGSSSIDIFAEQFGNAVTQAKQGDADVTALKSVVALVGTATKTPGIATNRVIDWLDRAGEGETPPWYELFTGNRDK